MAAVLSVVDCDGDPMFELRYGTPATDQECQHVMCNRGFAEAGGVALDECARILGRDRIKPAPHRFSDKDTQEIVLNWMR
jgi:hypothetical protein